MNDTPDTKPTTRYMRDEVHPSLPPALDQAAARSIAADSPVLGEFREAALSALRKNGLPGNKAEDFTFIRVNEFLPLLSSIPESALEVDPAKAWSMPKTAIMPTPELIKPLVFQESRDSYVVILDGEYSPGLSRPGDGYRIGPLDTAAPSLSPATKTALLAALARETDAAASLSAIFSSQPLLIQIDPGAAPATPLQVLHLRTSPLAARRDTFLVVAAGRLSESRILVRHAEAAAREPGTALREGAVRPMGGMSNVVSLMILDESASVKWLEAAPEGPADPGGSGNEADIHFHKLDAVLERDSRLFVAQASTGSRLARNAFSVDLHGQGAEVEINGATVLSGSRQAHNFLQIRHLVPHCTSRQHFKTVAADKGRASVDGTVFVAEGAQLTNANQLINNLMLSDEARADSKPRLLIHADDVKCTHGATAGKVDPAQLFYLESRGLPPAQARTLMTLAFIAEIVEKIGKALGPVGDGGAGGGAGAGVGTGASGSGFRAHLDATLLETLKRRLADPIEAAKETGSAGETGSQARPPSGQEGE